MSAVVVVVVGGGGGGVTIMSYGQMSGSYISLIPRFYLHAHTQTDQSKYEHAGKAWERG